MSCYHSNSWSENSTFHFPTLKNMKQLAIRNSLLSQRSSPALSTCDRCLVGTVCALPLGIWGGGENWITSQWCDDERVGNWGSRLRPSSSSLEEELALSLILHPNIVWTATDPRTHDTLYKLQLRMRTKAMSNLLWRMMRMWKYRVREGGSLIYQTRKGSGMHAK